jgi:uncharacterized protein (TIGR00725 family)
MTNGLSLDRDRRLLFRTGTVLDPTARRWTATKEPAGEPVGLRDAVRWLQTDSGSPCRVPVAVIGSRDASVAERRTAFAVGAGLAALGIVLLCGGKGGVMEAACEGAASAGGMSIGLLPDDEWQAANRFVTIPIATGIGVARNAIIARAGLALVALGGGYGTLSEIALALQFGRPVLTLLDAPAVSGVRPMDSVEGARRRLPHRSCPARISRCGLHQEQNRGFTA